ncbi:uncharacterized protein B0I36DRAFT_368087 [Microdochium trichocladiopsis]|uniref:Uncharacterized protein n=1 Tax=Microdochium trichocladiopsis TaxID=1682393 RepID=A0A9P8XTH2_9PEZI|nr:uncharacterized protein B0I36DRAFT_368087 [Microdochium trichocladiopsis]KAH7018035.1 hypothetical protein B0I36DRAFT_368087 [Microdochium trichocladiopsis]
MQPSNFWLLASGLLAVRAAGDPTPDTGDASANPHSLLTRQAYGYYMKCSGKETGSWKIGNTEINKSVCQSNCGCPSGGFSCLSYGQASAGQMKDICGGTNRSEYACRCYITPGCKRSLEGRVVCKRGVESEPELEEELVPVPPVDA